MKTARATISLPDPLMAAAQAHCDSQYLKFSNYVEKLVQKDLELVGKLPGDDAEAEVQTVRELIATKGRDAVRAKLAELSDNAVATEPALTGGAA